MLLASLPAHERKLYQLALVTLATVLVLGVLIGAIGAGEGTANRPDNWRASELRTGVDTLADFTAITAQSRWFLEGGQPISDSNTVGADEPESFRLLGIIDKGGQRYALFMPPASEAGRSKLVQFGVGESLVGNWKIQDIASAKVVVLDAGDNETRELLLYGTQAKAEKAPEVSGKHKANAKSAKTSLGSKSIAKPKGASANAQAKAKPKKDKAEIEKARAERSEKHAQAKAEAARKKTERDKAAKH